LQFSSTAGAGDQQYIGVVGIRWLESPSDIIPRDAPLASEARNPARPLRDPGRCRWHGRGVQIPRHTRSRSRRLSTGRASSIAIWSPATSCSPRGRDSRWPTVPDGPAGGTASGWRCGDDPRAELARGGEGSRAGEI